MTTCEKVGFLYKLGTKGGRKKRWFVLTGNYLYSYKDPQDIKECFIIALSNCRVEKNRDKHTFFIVQNLKDKYFTLAADTQVQQWITALQCVINRDQAPNVPPLELSSSAYETLRKRTELVPPLNNSIGLDKIGTFPGHLWELVVSFVATEYLRNIAFVCKPLYFCARHRINLTPEKLFGYWIFIFDMEHFGKLFAAANMEISDDIIHFTGMSPLSSKFVPLAGFGLRKRNTIAAVQYFKKGYHNRVRTSLILANLTYDTTARDFVLTGFFASQARALSFEEHDKGAIFGKKLRCTHANYMEFHPTIKVNPNREKPNTEIDKMHAQMTLSFKSKFLKWNSELAENLIGKWIFTFEFGEEKMEMEIGSNKHHECTVQGNIRTFKENGVEIGAVGGYLMCINREGQIGFSTSFVLDRRGSLPATLVCALGELAQQITNVGKEEATEEKKEEVKEMQEKGDTGGGGENQGERDRKNHTKHSERKATVDRDRIVGECVVEKDRKATKGAFFGVRLSSYHVHGVISDKDRKKGQEGDEKEGKRRGRATHM